MIGIIALVVLCCNVSSCRTVLLTFYMHLPPYKDLGKQWFLCLDSWAKNHACFRFQLWKKLGIVRRHYHFILLKYLNILYRYCIFHYIFLHFSAYLAIFFSIFLKIHNTMFRVGAKTEVESGNLKHLSLAEKLTTSMFFVLHWSMSSFLTFSKLNFNRTTFRSSGIVIKKRLGKGSQTIHCTNIHFCKRIKFS